MCTGIDKKVFSLSSVSPSSLVIFQHRVFRNQRPNVCNNYSFLKIVSGSGIHIEIVYSSKW